MSILSRCPHCDTFVKPASLGTDSCPFCPSVRTAGIRNPIPGLVLAATMAAMPACSDDDPTPDAQVGFDGAVYGIAIDASPVDAATPEDAMPLPDGDITIYGIAPE